MINFRGFWRELNTRTSSKKPDTVTLLYGNGLFFSIALFPVVAGSVAMSVFWNGTTRPNCSSNDLLN